MNETGCAFVCFILTMVCAVLSWFALKTGSAEMMPLILGFALIVVLISGFVVVCKYAA